MSSLEDSVSDCADAYIEHIAHMEQVAEISDFVYEHYGDGMEVERLDDSHLIDLADEGLGEMGEGDLSNGVRSCLQSLAHFGLASKAISEIYSRLSDAELEENDEVKREPDGDFVKVTTDDIHVYKIDDGEYEGWIKTNIGLYKKDVDFEPDTIMIMEGSLDGEG